MEPPPGEIHKYSKEPEYYVRETEIERVRGGETHTHTHTHTERERERERERAKARKRVKE